MLYLKDFWESAGFLFQHGREYNPGALALISRYVALGLLSMTLSALSLFTEWNLAVRIGLYVFSLVITAYIAEKLFVKLRYPKY